MDLAALLKETAQNMTVNARKAYVTLETQPSPPPCRAARTCWLSWPPQPCDNAIRYNQPGGHVSCAAAPAPTAPGWR